MKKIISVIGTRPNFMKIAPIEKEIRKHEHFFRHKICFTSQHYDKELTDFFFDDLQLSADFIIEQLVNVTDTNSMKPEFIRLKNKHYSNKFERLSDIFRGFINYLAKENPDVVLIPGDVNSSLVCALAAKKMGFKVAHLEAGLRSFDPEMEEEMNRIIIDQLSDYLFVSEPSGIENLNAVGYPGKKIYHVGNLMIDSLSGCLSKIEQVQSKILEKYKLTFHNYILVTLHRPSNVDDPVKLDQIIETLNLLSEAQKIIFPMHPRTLYNIIAFGLLEKIKFEILKPVGYIDFISLLKNCSLVLTDSGGIQEESTYLKVQCVTLRDSTERPITVYDGTNHLVGSDMEAASDKILQLLSGAEIKTGIVPLFWDGNTAGRIMDILIDEVFING